MTADFLQENALSQNNGLCYCRHDYVISKVKSMSPASPGAGLFSMSVA